MISHDFAVTAVLTLDSVDWLHLDHYCIRMSDFVLPATLRRRLVGISCFPRFLANSGHYLQALEVGTVNSTAAEGKPSK